MIINMIRVALIAMILNHFYPGSVQGLAFIAGIVIAAYFAYRLVVYLVSEALTPFFR